MNKTTLTLAMGGAITLLSGASFAAADSNPFGMQAVNSPVQMLAEADTTHPEAADKMKEGKCGEGKCGADKMKMKDKMKEGSCGADKMKDKMKEGSCGADKMKEGSCGAKK